MKLVSVLLLLVCAACAKPTYAPPANLGTSTAEKASDCQARFQTAGSCVTMAWETKPTDSDFGSFLFKTFRANHADGSPVVEDAGAQVKVVLFMPSMGHGSSPVTVDRLDTGTYRASRVFFTMQGHWEIRFQIFEAGVMRDQAVLPIDL